MIKYAGKTKLLQFPAKNLVYCAGFSLVIDKSPPLQESTTELAIWKKVSLFWQDSY